MTVGSLAYSIVANTQNFTAGIAASKSELKLLKDAFLASQSPTEMYSTAIERLEELAQKFPTKAAGIHTAIHQMTEAMHEAQSEGSLSHKVFEEFSNMIGGIPVVVDPVAAAFKVLEFGLEAVKEAAHVAIEVFEKSLEQIESLNKIGLTAGRLGMATDELIGFAGAANELTGAGLEEAAGMLTRFEATLGHAAAEGSGPAFEAFQRLGLSLSELSQMTPAEALLETSEALSKVENSYERLALAKDLAGKAAPQMVAFLAAGAEKIQEISEHVKDLEQAKFIDPEKIHEAAVALEDWEHLLNGIRNVLADELAPIVTDVTNDFISGFQEATNHGETLRSTIHEIAITTAELVDAMQAAVAAGNSLANNPLTRMLGAARSASIAGSDLLNTMFPGMGLISQLGFETGNALGNTMDANFSADHDTHTGRLLHQHGASGGWDDRQSEIVNKADAAFDREHAAAVDRMIEAKERADNAERLRDIQRQGEIADAESTADKAHAAEQARINKERLDTINRVVDLEGKTYADNEKRAEAIAKSQLTGAEKLRDEFTQLMELERGGFFDALAPGVFDKALDDLRSKARDMAGMDTGPHSIGAVHGGSVEALREGLATGSKDDKALEEAKKTADNTASATKLLEEIKTALAANALKEAV